MNYIRDYAMMVAIFGFASMAWYGWSQESPPKTWRKYIGILTGLASLLFLLGTYLSIKNWGEATALANHQSFIYYYVFVILEFVIAGIGAFVLFQNAIGYYTAPWVCFIVGVHFFGLSYVFDDFSLNILGFLLVLVSGISLYVSKNTKLTNSTITGIISGTLFLVFALINLIRFF